MKNIVLKRMLGLACIALFLFSLQTNLVGQSPPTLGTTSSFALFTAVGSFTNTDGSVVTGDVGTNAGAYAAFPPGTLIGSSHVEDGLSATAASDVAIAYSYLDGLGGGTIISTTLDGQILTPGLYTMGAAASLSGSLTLNGGGDPDALFILQIDGALSTASLSTIVLTGNASACNVYWQINGQVELGSGSVFQGTFIANGAIILLDGASLFGRGLTQAGAISANNNVVTLALQPIAAVISADGPTTFCEGDSVVLSGNIDGTWSTGDTTASITVFTAGDYFVTNTTICGSVTSNHIIVDIYSLQPTITASGSTSFCTGGSVTLTSSLSTGYVWNTGDTSRSIIVTTSGMYGVTTTDGCGSGTSASIEVIVSTDVMPTITADGPTEFCNGDQVILTSSVAASYMWSNGDTTQSIIVTTSGTYSVTTPDACTSEPIVVTVNLEPNCGGNPIPTLGQWSLTLLILLLMICGTLYFNGKESDKINAPF